MKTLAYGHMNRRKTQGRQVGLTGADIDDVGEKFWLTPPDLMRRLIEEFAFNFDACPYPRPAGLDNLKEEWGERAWVKKAAQERKKGKTVMMILPFPHWFRYLLDVGAEFRYPGPIRFQNRQGKKARAMGGGRVPDILVIMKPKRHDVLEHS